MKGMRFMPRGYGGDAAHARPGQADGWREQGVLAVARR